ncbi:MAG TPA: ABC transporter substrate-binding protein [Tepidisphaeraceae bacterium]|nr:ABC transporter substrate-binding protein [Tepidisphaeraceae bacterium]
MLKLRLYLITFVVTTIAATSWMCKSKPGTAGTATPTTVTVGFVPVTTSLPNWLAKDDPALVADGVKIEMKRYANSNVLLLALLSGECQATSVCADEPIIAQAAKGVPAFEVYLQEILSADRLFDAIVVPKDSAYTSMKDLSGKTIACFPGSQLKAYLNVILEGEGVDPATVKVVELPPANLLPAIESGTAQAAFVLEPTITIGAERGLTRVLLASPIVKHVGRGKPLPAASFLISKPWADANPKAADAFVRSVHRQVVRIEKDHALLAARYPEFTPVPATMASKVVITRFATNEQPDVAGLKLEAEVLKRVGAISTIPEVERLFYVWRSPASVAK